MLRFKQFLINESATGRQAEVERKVRERQTNLIYHENQKDVNLDRVRADIETEMGDEYPTNDYRTPELAGANVAKSSAELDAANQAFNNPNYSYMTRDERNSFIDRSGENAYYNTIDQYVEQEKAKKLDAAKKENEEMYGPETGGRGTYNELSPEEQKIWDKKAMDVSMQRQIDNRRAEQEKLARERAEEKAQQERNRQEKENLKKKMKEMEDLRRQLESEE